MGKKERRGEDTEERRGGTRRGKNPIRRDNNGETLPSCGSSGNSLYKVNISMNFLMCVLLNDIMNEGNNHSFIANQMSYYWIFSFLFLEVPLVPWKYNVSNCNGFY